MSLNNQVALRLVFSSGVRVGTADLQREQLANKSQIGKAVYYQQGTLNALPQPNGNPLAVTTNGTMQVSIGGNGQGVICDGWVCDGCPQQSFTVPANASGSTRVDLIAIQYAIVNSGTETDEFENASGVQTSGTSIISEDGVAYQYVQGNSSGVAPTAPVGWDAFATITVPTGTTVLTAANVAYLFPVMNPTGAMGPQGPQGPPGSAPIPVGPWSSTATYTSLEIVSYLGSSWIVVSGATPAVGTPPSASNSAWVLLASVGAQGAPGTNGVNGTNGINGTNGQDGATGPQGPQPWTYTVGPTLVPAVGAAGSFPVAFGDPLGFGVPVCVTDGTTAFIGKISKPASPLGITCTSIIAGGPGSVILGNALVTPIGLTGPQGPPGASTIGPQGLPGATGPQGPQGAPGLGLTGAIAGTSLSATFLTGTVPLYKRVNYGANEPNKSNPTDNSYAGLSSYLGAGSVVGIFLNAQTIEYSCRMQVKPGSGSQSIGGSIITNSSCKVFVDNATVFTGTLTELNQTWSGSIPDDQNYHTVTLHFNGPGQIIADFGRWIPESPSGGCDPNKFDYIGD